MHSPTSRQHQLVRGITAAIAAGLGLAAFDARAADITVDTTADSTLVDGQCSLREAVANANTGSVHGDCIAGDVNGPNAIFFDASLKGSTITLEDAAGGTLELSSPYGISIDGDVDGNGGRDITISGNGSMQVVDVQSGASATLQNLVIRDGNSNADGGGILNAGDLTVKNILVTDSEAVFGGGIGNWETLRVEDSIVSHNHADAGGGGIYNSGSATIRRSSIVANTADNYGGGISNSGSTTIVNSTLADNHADEYGGGIVVWVGWVVVHQSTIAENSSARGGGIYLNNDPFHLANSILVGNTATDPDHDEEGNCGGEGGAIIDGPNLFWPSPGPTCVGLVSDPLLGPLQYNGGTTPTMLPDPAGNVVTDLALCIDGITQDQRGQARPDAGNLCDLGAVEINAIDRDRIFADGFD